ncbi:hypothetical protein AtubIFM61612_002183 [Aspergillus tubingensis]|nr:hypothetical protein AtubIFM61612_002183 [Aspergillus tubingensis]
MPSISIRRLNNEAYTVALICPLEVELSAARYMLDEEHGMLLGNRKDPNIYILGSLSGHNVVLAALPKGSQGTASAAAVAIHLIRTFSAIKLRLLVGIGGGIPSLANDIRLGDVVLSAPDGLIGGVVEYDLGKETTNGFKRKGVLCPPPAEWRKAMANMASDHQVRANRIAVFLSDMLRKYPTLTEYQRPLPETDILFPADYIHAQDGESCVSCDAAKAVKRAPRTLPHESRVFYGIIASGNRVIKDGTKRDSIARESGGAMCCEMEAAGLMDQFQCVVIRGISDYCDSHKNDDWHAYAAGAAAALAKEALMYMEPHYNTPREEHSSEWKANVLKQLYTCNYLNAKDRNPQRVEGTFQWFTNHQLFQNWRENHGPGLLWVSADPGCGKSVLARYLLNEVLLSSETSVVCYFFFKEDFENRKSLVDALCCILHQIFEQIPRLLSDRLRSRFESETGHIYQSVWSLWSILCDLAEELPDEQVICVLDALDECGCDEQSQLTECLTNLYQNTTASSKLKFLVTSRPYSAIQRRFQSLENNFPAIHLRGEDNDEVQKIAGEINMVIELRVEELADRLQLLADERNLLLSELTSVQNRTYLWIDHIMSTLDDILTVTPTSIRAAIRRLPRSLDEAYDQILRRTPDPDRAMKILHIVVAANTPLTVADMATAVAVLDRKSPEDQLEIEPEHRTKRSIREICGLFITIIDSRIYLLHETARDFLVYKEGKSEPIPDLTWKASLIPHDSEWILAKACWKNALGYAAGRGHLNIIKMLLATGKVDPDFVDYAGLTPIVYAADAQHEDVVSFLLNTGRVNPNRKDSRGMTLLSRAAHRGHGSIVRILLDFGVKDLNSKDKYGRTPLLHAALTGHGNIVKSLLSTGIPDPNCRDAGGKTPLAQASYYGHDVIVGLLLENDEVDPDVQDNHGKTPLALACQGGHRSIVALLLKTGRVNPNSEDHYGTKLLTHATECGNEDIIKLISDAINSRDSESSPNTSSRSSLQLDAAPEFQPAIDAFMVEAKRNHQISWIWPRNILYPRWPQKQTVIPYKGSWLSR